MSKQFDLEQNILNAWCIIEDLEVLIKKWGDIEEDAKLNILIGLKELYGLKFETTFNSFEEFIHELANRK